MSGASGLVGAALVRSLQADGSHIRVISQSPERAVAALGGGVEAFGWDDAGVAAAVDGADAVVNLAGESLFARRWSRAFKERCRSSRVDSTNRLVRAIGAAEPDGRPAVLVSASAVGIYGPRDDTELDESASLGEDFLATLCRDWEAAASGAEAHGCRVVCLRIGVVCDRSGGAVRQMELPFKLFAGGPVWPGSQYFSWILNADLIRLIRHVIDHEALQGPVNATAPAPVTNREFSAALGRALGRPSWAPVPGFVLRLRFGEVASILTTGQRVVPAAALAAGFEFNHPAVGPALASLYAQP
ncbi:MAG: TIGR01777 family oxidoreductase [Planctomycetota bacterium]